MGDTKKGREKQANDEERRQRERELTEALERGDEPRPEGEDDGELGGLDRALEDHEYPTTAADVITAHGDREIETQDGRESLEAVLEPVDDDERYDSPDDVRSRVLGQIHRD